MAIRFGSILERGLGSAFYCWVREPLEEGGERFRLEDPERFWQVSWSQRKYTEFALARYVKPRGMITVSLRSRETFRYGVFQLNARLPDWGPEGPMLWFGFEAEDLFGGGVAHFMLQGSTLKAFAGAWLIPLSLRLPAPGDLAAERHTYTVKVHRNIALWFIDFKLVAAVALVDSEQPLALHEGEPYSVGATQLRPGSSLAVLIDIDGGPIDREWVWDDLHPWSIRVLDGDEQPNLVLKLYRHSSEDLVEGLLRGPVVSHPIPAAGSEVEIALAADVAGDARVEACSLSGEWFELEELELRAGRPLRWRARVGAPFIRVAVEPRGEGRVKLAEAYVS
uniref:Uncharacterized protein n=1 Tax=Thermofilum pendens TaxID=2269 RepID=A0A7J3X8F4_THEPE